MSTNALVVPAELVGNLRDGLHAALSFAAEEVTSVIFEPERSLEMYREPLARFDRVRALLDVIGWDREPDPAEARFDLREHLHATLDALEKEIDVASDRVKEAATVDAERAKRGEPPKREETIRRVLALREFAATVRAYVDSLEVPRR